MKIINLTQTQFKNYSNIHNQRNFGQTIEYSNLPMNSKHKRLFLGLIDDSNNIHAAALIIIKKISPNIYEAYSPNGFLIDYSNFDLVKIFTEELINYLKDEKVTYLIILYIFLKDYQNLFFYLRFFQSFYPFFFELFDELLRFLLLQLHIVF